MMPFCDVSTATDPTTLEAILSYCLLTLYMVTLLLVMKNICKYLIQ